MAGDRRCRPGHAPRPRHGRVRAPRVLRHRPARLRPPQAAPLDRYELRIPSGYDLGYLFGTFLGDGHAFLADSRNSEIGRVSIYIGAGEPEVRDRRRRGDRTAHRRRPRSSGPGRSITSTCTRCSGRGCSPQFGKRDDKHLPAEYLLHRPAVPARPVRRARRQRRSRRRRRSPRASATRHARCPSCSASCASSCHGTLPEVAARARHRRRTARRRRRRLPAELPLTAERRTRSATWPSTRSSSCSSVRDRASSIPVYDIEVDCPTHIFIADNAIVHNSICTTRVVAGVGVPQITAIYDCVEAADGTASRSSPTAASSTRATSPRRWPPAPAP